MMDVEPMNLPTEQYSTRSFLLYLSLVSSFVMAAMCLFFAWICWVTPGRFGLGIFVGLVGLGCLFMFLVCIPRLVKPRLLYRVDETGISYPRHPRVVRWDEMESIRVVFMSGLGTSRANVGQPVWVGIFLKKPEDFSVGLSGYGRWAARSNAKFYGTPAVFGGAGSVDVTVEAKKMEAYLRIARKAA